MPNPNITPLTQDQHHAALRTIHPFPNSRALALNLHQDGLTAWRCHGPNLSSLKARCRSIQFRRSTC